MGTRLLVSPPAYFTLERAANPWTMRNAGASATDAQRQWDRFIETLGAAADVEVHVMDAAPHAPDLVFTANAALVCDGLAIVSSFRHTEHRRAQSLFRQHLGKLGLATTYLRQTYFEGSSDAVFDRVRPVLYAGYGWRTERSAVMQLQEIVGSRVMPLLLVDERFYHLAMALNPLASGHVMAFMDALSPHAQIALRRSIDPAYLIEVGIEDALAFACAGVEVGDALVMHACSRRLRERLNHAGYRVFCTELEAFHKAGVGAKALVLKLDDGPALAAAAATA